MNGIGVVLLVLACFAQNIASKDCKRDAQSPSNGWKNYIWPEGAWHRAWELGEMDNWVCEPQFFCSGGQPYCWLLFSSGGVELHAHVPFVTGNDHRLFRNWLGDRGKKVINLAEKINGQPTNTNLFALMGMCMNGQMAPPENTVKLGDLARQSQGAGYYGELLRKLDVALQEAYNANPYQRGGK